jgi:hypothetical protein
LKYLQKLCYNAKNAIRFEQYLYKPAGKRDMVPWLKAHDRMQREHSQTEQPKSPYWVLIGRPFRYNAKACNKANLGGTADFRPMAKVFLFVKIELLYNHRHWEGDRNGKQP